MKIERPSKPYPKLKSILTLKSTEPTYMNLAIISFFTSVTGPLAILLAVSSEMGLQFSDITSWVFAGYTFGGIITIVLCYLYKQPIVILWGMTGAAILIGSVENMTLPEVIGAFMVTAFLVVTLGITGLIKKIMAYLPIPIVMGMVTGVFLPIVLKVVEAFEEMTFVPFLSIAVYIGIAILPSVSRRIPPILGAMITGVVFIVFTQGFHFVEPVGFSIVTPTFYAPVFSMNAIFELVLPLVITIIGIQNMQSISILKSYDFEPPTNVITLSSGISSVFMGLFGSAPGAAVGPVTAIFNSDGKKNDRYKSGIYLGIMVIIFGIFSPITVSLAMALPTAYVAFLGGLAMLPVLQKSFETAFRTNFTLGATVAFLVTISNITILNISAAFWGTLFGVIISLLLERREFRLLYRGDLENVK